MKQSRRKGRWVDNVFTERLWRSVKYEDIFLHAYETPREVKAALASYFSFYNAHRPHQSLDYRTPDEMYISPETGIAGAWCRVSAISPQPDSPSPKTRALCQPEPSFPPWRAYP